MYSATSLERLSLERLPLLRDYVSQNNFYIGMFNIPVPLLRGHSQFRIFCIAFWKVAQERNHCNIVATAHIDVSSLSSSLQSQHTSLSDKEILDFHINNKSTGHKAERSSLPNCTPTQDLNVFTTTSPLFGIYLLR